MALYERQEKDEARRIFPTLCIALGWALSETKYKSQKIEWKRVRKKEPEILIDRNNSDSDRAHVMRVEIPNASRPVEYQLFLRSLVPRLVERCQENCGTKL